jgi:hypothetical protein
MGIKNITEIDIELAKVYFTLLVEFSIRQETVNYGTLIELSKNRYKKNLFVYVGIPTTTGRRLSCLREHTDRLKLPDISSLVVRKGQNVSGDAYHLDSEKERKKVYKTHWLDYYCEVIHKLNTTLSEL